MKAILLIFAMAIVSNLNAQTNTCNCCTEKHSEFDFWIGEWTVTVSDTIVAGTNTIVKIEDNCLLRESWKSSKGNSTGTSLNFYNYKTKEWEQIWVDNQGGNLHLKGHRTDNQMILQSEEEKNTEGKSFFHRVTWTENSDGTVRQLWETITDGTEITVAFDGLYKKTK